jgi:hypothetical protein
VEGREALIVCKWLHSNAELVVRQPPAHEDENMEAEGSTMLKAITKQQLVKAQQTE